MSAEEVVETEMSLAITVIGGVILPVTAEVSSEDETRDRHPVAGKGPTLEIMIDGSRPLAVRIAERGTAAHLGEVDHRVRTVVVPSGVAHQFGGANQMTGLAGHHLVEVGPR